jgi:hypothetical protein
MHHLGGHKAELITARSKTQYQETKSGLQFKFSTTKGLKDWNVWMGEGFVEWAARLLSGEKDDEAYAEEVKAVEELMNSGVAVETFCKAFREDYLVGEAGVRLPALKVLLDQVTKLRGKAWLKEREDALAQRKDDVRRNLT